MTLILLQGMDDNFKLADIKIRDPLRERGVLYVGQYGTSGYATAAKGYICDFLMRGIPISWNPLKFDDSELSDDNFYNILAKTVIGKAISDVRTIILHCTADLWPTYKSENADKFLNRNIIGYTVWETNVLPISWPKFINESVNEVWCPSHYNYETFVNSGVTIPIRVVPHIFLKIDLPKREQVLLTDCVGNSIVDDPHVVTFYNNSIVDDPHAFTFYNISELNERKNVISLVETFCKAFTKSDSVRLLLKVHYKNYTTENLTYCINKIFAVLKDFPNHASVILITGNLTELELLSLHSIGDCYVSLTRSEAVGLTIFDAMNYGKKVIVTGYGGQVDYLGNNYSGLVSYKLVDVQNMDSFTHGYYMQGKQQWAAPNIDHAVELMRKVVNII